MGVERQGDIHQGKPGRVGTRGRAERKGILLVQETWRPEATERLSIWERTFYGTGNKEKPRGDGAGILVYESIEVESWHHNASRITAIMIPCGK